MAAPPEAGAGPGLAEQLNMLITGTWVTQMIYVASELGVADQLATGERDVDDLAAACGADAGALFRVLRGLASLGLFVETSPRRFALTPMAELLRSDHPQSMRSMGRLIGGPEFQDAWGELLHSVRTGESAFRHRYGKHVFEFYQGNPERMAVFDGAMTDYSRPETAALLSSYDFSGVKHLVDVGGGLGSTLLAVMEANPHLRGTLFDQPPVVAQVKPPPELADRFEAVGGDFFAEVPAGADAYLLKHIIHDWHAEADLTILRNVRAVMAPGARVLIMEWVIPPGNDPFPGKLLDINMLVMTEGGLERTADEYAQLLSQAGLKLARIVPTGSPISIVEAVAED